MKHGDATLTYNSCMSTIISLLVNLEHLNPLCDLIETTFKCHRCRALNTCTLFDGARNKMTINLIRLNLPSKFRLPFISFHPPQTSE